MKLFSLAALAGLAVSPVTECLALRMDSERSDSSGNGSASTGSPLGLRELLQSLPPGAELVMQIGDNIIHISGDTIRMSSSGQISKEKSDAAKAEAATIQYFTLSQLVEKKS